MKHRKDLAEQHLHGEPGFAAAVYPLNFPKNQTTLAPLHYHPEFELLIATKGTLRVQIEEHEYLLHPGEGVFINAACLHAIFSADDIDSGFLAIVFAAEFIATRDDRIYQTYLYPVMSRTLLLPEQLDASLTRRLLQLADIFKQRGFGYELTVKRELLSVLESLLTHASAPNATPPNARYESIKQALSYIESHYMEEISLEMLANESGLSREHFCRVFSEIADVSPITYLNRHRIQQSMELLRNTDESISNISARCGFSNCSYYNKLFRRFEGQTPKQYRKRSRGEDSQ